MPINHWPTTERPREKLLQKGSEALSDAELLAILLRTGVSGRSAVDLAREMLNHFGGLRPLLEAGPDAFGDIKGVGAAKYVQLQAVLEIGRRYLEAGLKRGDLLSSPRQTRHYLTTRLRHHPHEVFAALFLDNRHRIITYEELFRGTIDGASVHPREVVKRALAHNAAAVIFAHNHPSGVSEPSEADRAITRRLKEALALVEIRVLDHFIIGDREAYSFAEQGLM